MAKSLDSSEKLTVLWTSEDREVALKPAGPVRICRGSRRNLKKWISTWSTWVNPWPN